MSKTFYNTFLILVATAISVAIFECGAALLQLDSAHLSSNAFIAANQLVGFIVSFILMFVCWVPGFVLAIDKWRDE